MKAECQILMLEQIAYHIFDRDYQGNKQKLKKQYI
jgi:hypothetical protein